MKIGVFMFATDYAIRIDELAQEVESRGFESLFVPEHTHIPTSRESAWPGGPDLPQEYWHTHDPVVSLMAAAASTKDLRIGTGICLLTEHNPITLAKQAASLDFLSNGRFELGIGAGWNAEEMLNHGTDFKSRFKVMSERAKAIKNYGLKKPLSSTVNSLTLTQCGLFQSPPRIHIRLSLLAVNRITHFVV